MIGYECVRSKSSTTTAFVARGTCATSEFIYSNEDGVCTNASGSESCDRNPVASECFICSWIESIHSTIFMDEATTTSMLIPERVFKHFWHQASHKFLTRRLDPNHLLALVSSAFLVVSPITIYFRLWKNNVQIYLSFTHFSIICNNVSATQQCITVWISHRYSYSSLTLFFTGYVCIWCTTFFLPAFT